MKLINTFLLSLVLPIAALADPAPLPRVEIEAMVAQIQEVMTAGLCAVANDKEDHGTEVMVVLLPKPVGARRILVNDYNWMRNAGYDKASDGRFLMSVRAEEACSVDALSGRCLAFRSFWTRKPGARPGNGIRILPR